MSPMKKKRQLCYTCGVGLFGTHYEFQQRGPVNRCNLNTCRSIVYPHANHPFFSCGDGSKATPFKRQVAVLFCKLAGVSNTMSKQLISSLNHKVFERISTSIDLQRKKYVTKAEKKSNLETVPYGKTGKQTKPSSPN